MQFKKIFWYFISILFAIFSTLFIAAILSHILNTVLFFSVFLIAIVLSAMLAIIWHIQNKNLFESLLYFISISLICININLIAPVFIDRSLSVFIYFYSTEKGSISTDIYDENFNKEFTLRRIKDAEKMKFITCEENICKPTCKAKLAYYLLTPLGKITNSLDNYKKFRQSIDKNK